MGSAGFVGDGVDRIIKLYFMSGFNRVSLGLQQFSDTEIMTGRLVATTRM